MLYDPSVRGAIEMATTPVARHSAGAAGTTRINHVGWDKVAKGDRVNP